MSNSEFLGENLDKAGSVEQRRGSCGGSTLDHMIIREQKQPTVGAYTNMASQISKNKLVSHSPSPMLTKQNSLSTSK